MREIQAKLGRRSREEEFMYLLGAYMSDGSSFNKTTLARSIGIRLAKRYPWSKDFGDGMCQALGACGIYAHRVQGTPAKTTHKRTEDGLVKISQSPKHNWASENSPLLHWVHSTCLGYTDAAPKAKQEVQAEWVFGAPTHLRRAVLQGLGDGDGSASIQGNYVCISSKHNKDFIERLLQSFGVNTRRTPKDVVTTGMVEAKKAARIPPFRFASSRLQACERMVRRIDAPRRVRNNPLQPEETDFLLSMKKKGMTAWQASEAFFDRFGTAIHKAVVERVFRNESGLRKKRERN
jgi:hypothetical protein